MRGWIGLFAAVLLASAPVPAAAQKAVLVVRHAEKQTESNDPATPLSRAGSQRAQRLAEMLRDAGVTAIYSTDTVRTRSTVEPLARMRRLEIRTYEARDSAGKLDPGIVVSRLQQSSPEDVVLVVGHGDTIGPLLEALGCREAIRIGANDYDDLFMVAPRPGREPALVRLKF